MSDKLISSIEAPFVGISNQRSNATLAELKIGLPESQGDYKFVPKSDQSEDTNKTSGVIVEINPLSTSVQTSVVYPNDPRLKIYKQIENA
jgi:hypothetical protein